MNGLQELIEPNRPIGHNIAVPGPSIGPLIRAAVAVALAHRNPH
jgi:hypothetical protein